MELFGGFGKEGLPACKKREAVRGCEFSISNTTVIITSEPAEGHRGGVLGYLGQSEGDGMAVVDTGRRSVEIKDSHRHSTGGIAEMSVACTMVWRGHHT